MEPTPFSVDARAAAGRHDAGGWIAPRRPGPKRARWLLAVCLLLPAPGWTQPVDTPPPYRFDPGLDRGLDRGARQDLDRLQRGKTTIAPDQDPTRANTAADVTPHERRQQLEQLTTQEANRRDALRRHYRGKFDTAPAPMQRLDSIHERRQYQLRQQRQLRQFRSERGLPPRTLR
jgi:hypothetical protein